MPKLDIVLINPGDRRQVYQDLGQDYSAVEPPFWLAVLAAYLRDKGFSVALIDANAENITPQETAGKVRDLTPLLCAVIVYGSQPSASTQNMTIAGKICAAVKNDTSAKVALGGLHPSALPERTIREEAVDFVIEGEGPYTLESLIHVLQTDKKNFQEVPALWYRDGETIKNNPRAQLIEDIDSVLGTVAWDLLPMAKYKAHNWHCFDHLEERMPYAAIYTSLGCPYNCVFCCINALFGKPGIRYRSPERVVEEIGILVNEYGVKNIKIIDELFVLNEKHYMAIVDLLLEKRHNLNLWVYARVDTVQPRNLAKMKQAGINWIALGIESANPQVRAKALKRMRVHDVRQVVRQIQAAGIRVIGNFIFGLPEDTEETMRQTLDMAVDLNCEFVNFYCAAAYPGSALYGIAVQEGWPLPKEWHGFSQHAYDALPLPTRRLSAKEVLRFRDNAFHEYFQNPAYLDMLENKFGKPVKEHVVEMTKTRLKRRLLE